MDTYAPVPQAAPAEGAPAGSELTPLDRTIRRGVWYAIAAVLVTLAALWFLGRITNLVRYLVLAQLLAFALEPAVTWLHERHGWRRGTATALLLVGFFAVLVVIAVAMVGILASELDDAVDSLPAWLDNLNRFTQDHLGTTVVSDSSAEQSVEASEQAVSYLSEHAADVLGAVGSLLGGIVATFTVGLFTFYLTADGPKVRRALLSRMPPQRQRHVLWACNTAIQKTGGYLYSRALLALINGTLLFVTLLFVGTPYALPLAVFSGLVASFIPIVGTYIAGAVPVLVTLLAAGFGPGLIVLAEILLYQQVENYVLSPHLSKRTMELNPGIAFAAAMAGGAVGGFVGAFFALPIAAVIQAFISTYARRYEVAEEDLDLAVGTRTGRRSSRRAGKRTVTTDGDHAAPN
jgi:predicted PurR-regulated permease PerM